MTTRRRVGLSALLVVLGTVVGLLLSETTLRLLFPSSPMGTGYELEWFRKRPTGKTQIMTPDRELGFRPVLDGSAYNRDGILVPSSVLSVDPSARKILFVGDSVTSRGRIIRALARHVHSDHVTYLNGGVESYNVVQEVEFFFRYQSRLRIDQIVHLLHTNDLQYTPIAFFDDDDVLNVFAMNTDRRGVNPWLFQHSYLYRLVVAATFPKVGMDGLVAQTRASLQRMRDETHRRGINYTVALFPIVSPPNQWTDFDRQSRDTLLKICADLGIEVVDLLPAMRSMYAAGIDPREAPGDYWHPNDRFADAVSEALLKAKPGLTEP